MNVISSSNVERLTFGLMLRLLRALVGLRLVGGRRRGGAVDASVRGLGRGRARAALHADQVLLGTTSASVYCPSLSLCVHDPRNVDCGRKTEAYIHR